MTTQYSLININQLDLDALSTYLIHKNKLVYRTLAADSKSEDTDKVGGVSANTIAVAVSKNNRETVKNALQLGGLDASEYMTTTTGVNLMQTQDRLKDTQAKEIADLRDELYQLKNELLRNGAIEYYGQYGGFTDPFRRKEYVNIQEAVGTATSVGTKNDKEIIINDKAAYDAFDKYDFVCVFNTANEFFNIRQIVEKNDSRQSFILNGNLDGNTVIGSELEVYKSKGIIHNGQYKFASDEDVAMGNEQFYNGLTDDAFIKTHRIQKSNTGYGCSFRVPAEEQGFVTGFKIGAKATGNPGALVCYLFDSRDIESFKNAEQLQGQYLRDFQDEKLDGVKFFAKSQPLVWEEGEGRRYKYFSFQQQDGSYPLMSKDQFGENPVRYIAVIECLEADTSNFYDVIFIQHKDTAGALGDLELNNITYYYTRQGSDSKNMALATDESINAFDMYHQIVTRNAKEEEPEAQRQGLYTAHYSVQNMKYPATKARLTLRVKREGMYKVNIEKGMVLSDNTVPIIKDGSPKVINTVNNMHLKSETIKRKELVGQDGKTSEQIDVVVGNNITKVNSFLTGQINTDDIIQTVDGDKVYRMNYLVSMKARVIEYDKTTGQPNISNYDHYVMPLKEVFKDLNPASRKFSDRLIFECDITKTDENGYLLPYNDFEFQIFWENQDLPMPEENERIDEEYMATIKDLVFSLDRGF